MRRQHQFRGLTALVLKDALAAQIEASVEHKTVRPRSYCWPGRLLSCKKTGRRLIHH